MEKVFVVAPERVQEIVAEELGMDENGLIRKVSSAQKDEVQKLANIYTKLNNLAMVMIFHIN